MITYAERSCFRKSQLDLLERSLLRVAAVSRSWGNELRCHELARALHVVLDDRQHGLVVVDGMCGPVEHTWLACSDGVLLDPYVPGRLPQVQLVDPLVAVRLYRAGDRRDDIQQSVVDNVVTEMRRLG